MLTTPLFLLVLAQAPDLDAAAYLAEHRAADLALTAGDLEVAHARFERCLELSPRNPTLLYGLACADARRGEPEEAMAHLVLAVDEGFADPALARWDEDLASLRVDPRFVKLLERMTKETDRFDCAFSRITKVKDGERGVATIDPRGRVVALQSDTGQILLVEAHSGREMRRIDAFSERIWSLAYSPDGKLLAGVTYGGIFAVFDVDTGEPAWTSDLLKAEQEYRYAFGSKIAFDPTGERVLVSLSDRGAALWTAALGELLQEIETPLGNFFGSKATWSPDGERIAYPAGNEIVFLDGRTAQRLEALTQDEPVAGVDFSPDGKLLAIGLEGKGNAIVRDLASGEVIRRTQVDDLIPDDARIPVVRFSPNGKLLAYSSASTANVQIDGVHDEKQYFKSGFLGGRMGEPVECRFSPDGSQLWYAWRSGVMHFTQVDVATGEKSEYPGACPPHIADSGLAVAATWGGIIVFDSNTGVFRWHRTELADGGYVLQTPGGYLAGDFADLEELSQRVARDTVSVAKNITTLHDPKRVRAALEGVPLAPIDR